MPVMPRSLESLRNSSRTYARNDCRECRVRRYGRVALIHAWVTDVLADAVLVKQKAAIYVEPEIVDQFA